MSIFEQTVEIIRRYIAVGMDDLEHTAAASFFLKEEKKTKHGVWLCIFDVYHNLRKKEVYLSRKRRHSPQTSHIVEDIWNIKLQILF